MTGTVRSVSVSWLAEHTPYEKQASAKTPDLVDVTDEHMLISSVVSIVEFSAEMLSLVQMQPEKWP